MANAPFGTNKTRRYVSCGGEGELFQSKDILRHGSIELVDYMGGDETVERVATAGHGRGIFPEKPGQEDFIGYLGSRGIIDPFRSVQFKFSIQAPIEVALRLVYNQSASVNEYSGRYSVMMDTAFTPSVNDVKDMLGKEGDLQKAERIHELLSSVRERSVGRYKQLISQDIDMTRELARAGLGINNDTRFFWKIDLPSLVDLVEREGAFWERPGSERVMAYVDELARIAGRVAPISWDVLKGLRTEERKDISLTLPTDDEVVDGPLCPPSWKESETLRKTVPALEEIMFERKGVLNHGEFQVVDYMGDDDSFAEAARTSYGAGTKTLQNNNGLIKTLIRDMHTSPIEMAEMAVETKAPLFVDPRQLGRHRTLDKHGFMGYFPLGSQHHFPEDGEFKHQDRKNRQGRGKEMDYQEREFAKGTIADGFQDELHTVGLLRKEGAPEDLVRFAKGVGFYTKTWRAGDTLNWGRFLGLRMDVHAQKESRDIAYLIDDAQKRHTPLANEALHNYWFGGMRLSAQHVNAISESNIMNGFDAENMDFFVKAGLVLPVDRDDSSKGVKLSREGETLKSNLLRLNKP
jgi:thymidylate synthase (FAD)